MNLRLLMLGVLLPALSLAGPRATRAEFDIVCGARFYNPPSGSEGATSSHYHLFRVDAETGRRRQITRGEHDEGLPQWSPDGRRISFWRDGLIHVINTDGSGLRRLNLDATDGLQWSPDSRELATLNGDKHLISFVNVGTGKQRALSGANAFAWSPGGRFLAWAGTDKRLWIANLKTKSRVSAPLQAAGLAWAGPQVLVAALWRAAKAGEVPGMDTFVTLDTQAREIKRFPIRDRVPSDQGTSISDEGVSDPRSNLMPVPGDPGAFTFRLDSSTSSGRDGFYFRGEASTGALKLVARGQSFAWAPGGKRFAWAPYYDLSDYNAPGRRKRVVYTSPLKVNDGRRERTLISGLVLIAGCDWR